MGVVRFCVVFNKPNKVYYAGEMVTGRVELVLNSIMKIRGVELKIKGKAKCKWDEDTGRFTKYRNSEIYIKSKQILTERRDNFKLPAGKYSYPFSVLIPLKAPSSFSGGYGEILYYGKVKIDIPLAFDKKERTIFTVISPLNLNLFPNLKTPYKTKKSKTFHCLWCTIGQLTMVVRLPRTGFVGTESIPITLEIDNASGITVHAVYVHLKRKICYTSEEKWDIFCTADWEHKHEDSELQKLRLGRVGEGQSQTWSENVKIPSISFPNLDGCTFIKIEHVLHIRVATIGVHSDLKMNIPVKIADVLLNKNPDAPTITPQMQPFPNIACNPGMQTPAEEVPSPNPNHNPPARNLRNLPYPLINGDAPVEVPLLQICPSAPSGHVVPQPEINNASPNPGFVVPSPHSNTGGMPQIPIQENSGPVQQYPSQAPSALPVLPPKPATNPERSQNPPHPPVDADADTGYGFALPSFNSDVQLENTSFLNDSKGQNGENATVTTPLPPHSGPD